MKKFRFACAFLAVMLAAGVFPALSSGGSATLAVASTTLYGSSANKRHNVELAARALDGWCLETGEEFSFNFVIGARSWEEGYLAAKNGRGGTVTGGGVAQLATTLNLALRGTSFARIGAYSTYGYRFTDNYVSNGADAVITDWANGYDYTFISMYGGVLRLNAWISGDTLYVSVSEGNMLRPSEAIVTESSYFTGNNPVVDGKKAFDRDPETAWNVRENRGIGEWLDIRSAYGTRTFTGFSILNGYCKYSDEHGTWDRWRANTRVRMLEVYCDGTYVMTCSLQDIHSYQKFNFPYPVTGSALRFQIVSVYKGDKYNDACISEMKIYCE